MVVSGCACGGLGLARRSGCPPASWLAPSCSAASAPPSAEARLSVAGATPSPSSCSCWRYCPPPELLRPGSSAPSIGAALPAPLCSTAAARATHSARSLLTVRRLRSRRGAVTPTVFVRKPHDLTRPRGSIGCPPGTLMPRHQSHPAATPGPVWIPDPTFAPCAPAGLGWGLDNFMLPSLIRALL